MRHGTFEERNSLGILMTNSFLIWDMSRTGCQWEKPGATMQCYDSHEKYCKFIVVKRYIYIITYYYIILNTYKLSITKQHTYPLVNVYIIMERSTMLLSSVNPLFRLGRFPVSKLFLSLPGWVNIMKHIPFGDGRHKPCQTCQIGSLSPDPIKLCFCPFFFLYFSAAKDGSMTNSASTWEITWVFGYVLFDLDPRYPSTMTHKKSSKSSKFSRGIHPGGFCSPESMDQSSRLPAIGSSKNVEFFDLKRGITHCWQFRKNRNH